MIDYRKLNIGDKLLFTAYTPDGKKIEDICTVSARYRDYAIAEYNESRIRIDNDDADLFYPVQINQDGNLVHENIVKFPTPR
jgi:hypothetical protein